MIIVVIGGGLVGLATALKLQRALPAARILVLEKESNFGQHQSTHNSGVLHAGLYYKPGSLKARLAVEGIRELTTFCRTHEIAHEICGKVVVAVDAEEVTRLRVLHERAQSNGLQGVRWLSSDELREREPYANGKAALLVPEEGIVDYAAVVAKLADSIRKANGELLTSARVIGVERRGNYWRVQHAQGDVEANFIVNCAGLHCDRVSALAGEARRTRIVPFRGEYFVLRPQRTHLVKHLIYPVPDPQFPFLGVHFTRMIQGGVEAGPNAVLAGAREGYRKSDLHLGELLDALTFPGLWRFMRKHGRLCFEEVRRSFSKQLFCASLQRLVPEVRLEDLSPGGAGVRAQAMTPRGELVQDFELIERPDALHVLNAPSPAATASLAIGGEIALRVARQLQ
ncbi:MAG TPA: L-2-hydroxyglutarate oxidase [Opitutaceae bacterium]|nr:L-2-hydroxyglutarate oxidase [Opitutaceae bacterium]